MGLLKHVLLPAFGLMHAAAVVSCSDLSRWAGMVGLPSTSVIAADKDSVRQNHMLGAIRGFNVALMVLCGMGVLKESAHFRGQIILAEAALFGVVALDAFKLGSLNYFVPLSQAIIAGAGYVVNSMEPGIFTKDKK